MTFRLRDQYILEGEASDLTNWQAQMESHAARLAGLHNVRLVGGYKLLTSPKTPGDPEIGFALPEISVLVDGQIKERW